MKALVFDRIGSPLDVLYLTDLPMPQPKDGEALVRMVAAPISPGDFLFVENLYPEPKKPQFPQQIGGNHGMGVVEAVGRNVTVAVGTPVAFSYYNSWAEYAAVPAEWLMPLPRDFPVEKGSQFFNLITAWDLLEAARPQPGSWLALTAGYSTVSIMTQQFAKQRDVHVLSVARRARKDLDLRTMGAAAVIDLSAASESIGEQVMAITGGNGIGALIDSVGGPVTGELIRSMGFGGHVVINGGMSPDRFELHNFDVLLKGLEIRAHVYRYFFDPPKASDAYVLREIAGIAGRPEFSVPVGGMHSLEEFTTAIGESVRNPGKGKRFFRM
ncbi:quinone oxidoreductase family protein [Inquilinus sp. OTU3971]|uniref:quinone oxidoreductase family protein n=1 Tax=Inquilinus sp. OTU3971 TaxID=3043855 RepID=UPI00313F2334